MTNPGWKEIQTFKHPGQYRTFLHRIEDHFERQTSLQLKDLIFFFAPSNRFHHIILAFCKYLSNTKTLRLERAQVCSHHFKIRAEKFITRLSRFCTGEYPSITRLTFYPLNHQKVARTSIRTQCCRNTMPYFFENDTEYERIEHDTFR
jgi:hypothetical protein